MNNSTAENNTSSGHSKGGSGGHERIEMGRRNSSLTNFISDDGNNTDRSEIVIDNKTPEGIAAFKRVANSDTIVCRDLNGNYKSLRYNKENGSMTTDGNLNSAVNGTASTLSRFKSTNTPLENLDLLGNESYSGSSKGFENDECSESFDMVDPVFHNTKRAHKSLSKEKSSGLPPQETTVLMYKNANGKRKSDEIDNINYENMMDNCHNKQSNSNPAAALQMPLVEDENTKNTADDGKSRVNFKKQKISHLKNVHKSNITHATEQFLSINQDQRSSVDPDALFYNLEDVPQELFSSFENITEYNLCYNKVKAINLNKILPPINLKVLKEIELKENLKNVQLRHDIVFDPFLQFKPNVDGEKGLKKRKLEHKYWNYLLIELILLFHSPEDFKPSSSLLHTMFLTLRDIMASLLKESEFSTNNTEAVNSEILNLCENISPDKILTDLYERQVFDIVHFAKYLKFFLQRLCAPMRDPLIDKLYENFIASAHVLENHGAVQDIKFFTGILNQFQFVFKILELMKLDVANHQIRLIRPALISNCVNFERQFFLQVVFPDLRFDKKSLVSWIYFPLDNNLQLDLSIMKKKSPIYWTNIFRTANHEQVSLKMNVQFFYNNIYVYNVLRLLSCCMLTKNMPALLRFDVSRLFLLRSDLRECICLLIVKFLYKQLIYDDKTIDKEEDKLKLLKMYDTSMLRSEIIGIITDDNGTYRWTKNVTELSLYLLNKINNLKESLNVGSRNDRILEEKISFTQNWLQKQIQPNSDVYQLLEFNVIKSIAKYVQEKSQISAAGAINMGFFESLINNQNPSSTTSTSSASVHPSECANNSQDSLFNISEIDTLKNNLYQLISLNWSVINDKYAELLYDKATITNSS